MEERSHVISALEAKVIQLEEEKEKLMLEAQAEDEAAKMLSSSSSAGREPFSYTPKDIYAMEQLILLLRRETADFKVALKERDDTIIAMRKDLQGAQVRGGIEGWVDEGGCGGKRRG